MANVDLGQMTIDHVPEIGNLDIIALVAQIDLGMQQFSRCPSATSTDVHAADLMVAKGWIERFDGYFQLFAGLPELYLPKAHPSPQKLPSPPTINIVQNPAMQHMLYSMNALRTELLHSENAERINTFHPQSASTVIAPWIAKFKLFLGTVEENINTPANTWLPDADLQEPGVNPGEPR